MPRKVLVFMVLGVFFGMMAGVAVAGEMEKDSYNNPALWQQSADPESSLGRQASEPVETGSVPSMGQEEYQGQGQPESFTVEEIGGRMYRVGLDDGS